MKPMKSLLYVGMGCTILSFFIGFWGASFGWGFEGISIQIVFTAVGLFAFFNWSLGLWKK